ncbi:MAG TPA: double zinc ribbon domain-containing protein, partial [Polyangia bacterium]
MNGSSTPRGGLGGRLWRAALELLYPARCAACDVVLERPDDIFCAGCALTLSPIIDACPRCARPLVATAPPATARPAPCLGCLERPPRFGAAVAGFEFGGAIAEAIRKLKWGHMPELAPALGVLLLEALRRAP